MSLENKHNSFFDKCSGLILLFAGFSNAVYLSIAHYRTYTDINYSSFCAVSKSLNCDTVSQSSFSIFLGMPVPVLGVAGFLLLILIFPFLFSSKNNLKRLRHLFLGLTIIYSIYSLILAFISTYYIHSYCLMCLFSYAIVFLLFLWACKISKQNSRFGLLKELTGDLKALKNGFGVLKGLLIGFGIIFIVLWTMFPKYWILEYDTNQSAIPKGITKDGSHWIGAEKPELTIIEYTDYMCFQCRKMHFFLRSLVSKYPDKLRLVHKHFPLDKKYNFAIKETVHQGAGDMAMLAIYAGFKERFWEMNDTLFSLDLSIGTIDLKELSQKIGFEPGELSWAIEQKQIRLILKRDIAQGAKNGVAGTPTFIIEDQVYTGVFPAFVFEKLK